MSILLRLTFFVFHSTLLIFGILGAGQNNAFLVVSMGVLLVPLTAIILLPEKHVWLKKIFGCGVITIFVLFALLVMLLAAIDD
jgi:hypothetical protein